MPDKRLLMRATAVLIVGGTLLTGCGRGSHPQTTPPSGASTSAPSSAKPAAAPTSAKGADHAKGADPDLENADNLLQQVDGQVSAADKTPNDAD